MAFQDDIAQINTNEEQVQKCIQITEAFQHKKRMKFNAAKTQIMKFNTEKKTTRQFAHCQEAWRVLLLQMYHFLFGFSNFFNIFPTFAKFRVEDGGLGMNLPIIFVTPAGVSKKIPAFNFQIHLFPIFTPWPTRPTP